MRRFDRGWKLQFTVVAFLVGGMGAVVSGPLYAVNSPVVPRTTDGDETQPGQNEDPKPEEKKSAEKDGKGKARQEEQKKTSEAKEAQASGPAETDGAKKKKDAKESSAKKKAAAAVLKQLEGAKLRKPVTATAAGAAPRQEKVSATSEAQQARAPEEAAKKSDEHKEETVEKKKKKKKKAPDAPMFRMRDGTRIAGHAEMKALGINTAYGQLVVPVEEIVRVRFSSPRDPELDERIRTFVQQLGSDEFDLREEATEELRAIGIPALEALREAAKAEDQEVKTRAEKLLAQLEEELEELQEDQKPYLVALQGEEDEVVTLKFTAKGRVDLTELTVTTPYGKLTLRRADVLSIVFRPPPFRRLTFDIGGSKAYAGNKKWVDTGIKLTQGTFLKVTASGSLNLSNYGTNCSPDGTTGVPANGLDDFPVGALVGRIGSKGKPFLIGSEFEGTANATGDLQLGISFKSGSMRGKFEVEVEVRIEEDEE